jgi:hypothetical protein
LRHRAPTACKCMVSGTFNSANSLAFHLSVTLLLHYRSLRNIQPWVVVHPDSHGVQRAPCYSGTPRNGGSTPSHTGVLPSMPRLSNASARIDLCNPLRRPQPRDESRFGLDPRSLPPPMHSVTDDRHRCRTGFPIRKSVGHTLGCQLTTAYRRLQRPSSLLSAKASTMHP